MAAAAPLRFPLFSSDAEESVLGSCLIDPDAIHRIPFIAVKDFFREQNQWVYKALKTLSERGEAIDPITVEDELVRMGRFADISPVYLSDLMDRTPTAIHVEHYARIVERHSVLRRLHGAAEKVAKLAYEESERDLQDIIAEAESIIFKAAQRVHYREAANVQDVVGEAYERFEAMALGQSVTGVPTPWKALNDKLGGYKPSALYVLAARPGMGKTSFMGEVMTGVAQWGGQALCFSLEMDRVSLVNRMIAAQSGTNLKVLNDGPIGDDLLERLAIAGEGVKAFPGEIWIDDERGLSPSTIRSKSLRLAARGRKPDIIFVDHLQEVGDRGVGTGQSSDAYLVGQKCRAIRNLGGELGIPVVLLAQLNRKCEERADKRPMLSDLKDSGGIEETADVVMFLYRDEVYNPNTDRPNIVEVIIPKHRNGPTGTVDLRFEKETGRWSNLETFGSDGW